MTSSFIASPRSDRSQLASVAQELGWQGDIVDAGGWSVALAGGQHAAGARISRIVPDRVLVLVGEVLNHQQLRALLCAYDSQALTANDAELLHLLVTLFGTSALGLVDGGFAGLLLDDRGGPARVFTDATGMMPCYLTRGARPWISAQIKLLCRRPDFLAEFMPAEAVVSAARREDGFCPVSNLRKVKPGEVLAVGTDGMELPVVESSIYHAFRPRADRELDRRGALDMVDALLTSAVRQCAAGGRVGVPLSGGLDSSLVAALARQSVADLSTFSIGTRLSDEFEYAAQVARHLGTRHQEFLLSDHEVLTGLVEAIYFNEIYDGLSAEIQAPLFAVYGRTSGLVDTLVTGYGSDLLFGGVLPLQRPSREANLALWEQVYRTRWTGEFGTFGALRHGIRVRHPFWSNRLIGFCLDLSPSLKVSPQEVKILLREYAAADASLLPDNIVWRKKIGIHEGSAINRMFAGRLNTDTARYDFKSLFTYFVYREFLEHGRSLGAADPDELLKRFEAGLEGRT